MQSIPRQQPAQVSCKFLEEPHNMLRLPAKLRPQLRPLRRDAGRTRIQVALPRHVAANRDQYRCTERKLIRPQQSGNQHILRRGQATIGPQTHPAPHAILHQHLLGLGQPKLPRIARVLDARKRSRTGPARISGNHDEVRVGLRHARGHRPHAALRDQLHPNRSPRIDTLQVVDQLRQVFDRINIVMRRRRDQRHAGLSVTKPCNQATYLVARKLTSLSGLGTLCHLDLNLIGMRKVLRRHAESSGGHLLDLVVLEHWGSERQRRQLRHRSPPSRKRSTRSVDARDRRRHLVYLAILTTFTGIRAPAQHIHRNRDALVGLRAQRSKRHRTRDKPLVQTLRRLHLRQVKRFSRRLDRQQIAQHGRLARVQILSKDRERRRRIGRHHASARAPQHRLQRLYIARLPRMRLGTVRLTESHPTVVGQFRCNRRRGRQPAKAQLTVELRKPDSRERRRRVQKATVHHARMQPQDVEQVSPAVAVHDRDSHLRHHLREPGVEGFQHLLLGLLRLRSAKRPRRLKREPGANRTRAIADQHGRVVNVAAIPRLYGESRQGPQPGRHQRLVHRARRHRHRNRQQCLHRLAWSTRRTIRHQQDSPAIPHQFNRPLAHHSQRVLKRHRRRIDTGQFRHGELCGVRVCSAPQRCDLCDREIRRLERNTRQRGDLVEQVRPRTKPCMQRHHHRLAQRIDRRIRHLRKALPKERIDRSGRTRQKRQRRVVTHRPHTVLALCCHRLQHHLHVFARVAKATLHHHQCIGRDNGAGVRSLKCCRLQKLRVVRARVEDAQQLFVLIDPAIHQVYYQHLARSKPSTAGHLRRIEIDQPRLRARNNKAIFRNCKAIRTQAIPVERRTHHASVREGNCSRTIPRLRTIRVVAQKWRSSLCICSRRKQHPNSLRDRTPVLRHQLNCFVQARRIRAALRQYRLALHRQRGITSRHARPVAPHRVDLAVVSQHPRRLRTIPRRCRIGRIALMKDGERRNKFRRLEVRIKLAHQRTRTHRLVHNRPRRERTDISVNLARFMHALKLLARQIKSALYRS